MLRYLHSLSAALFYLVAGSFFVAYLLLHNGMVTRLAAQYLYVGQVPILIVSLLYGGLSVYRSLQGETGASRTLAIIIAFPLALIFLLFFFVRLQPTP